MTTPTLLATEIQRAEIQQRLDGERTATERNRLGQFATPQPLALEITHYVSSLLPTDGSPIHFAEPALGSSCAILSHGSLVGHDGPVHPGSVSPQGGPSC